MMATCILKFPKLGSWVNPLLDTYPKTINRVACLLWGTLPLSHKAISPNEKRKASCYPLSQESIRQNERALFLEAGVYPIHQQPCHVFLYTLTCVICQAKINSW